MDFEKLLMGAGFYLKLLRGKGFIKILSFKNSELITVSSYSSTVNNFISGLGKKTYPQAFFKETKNGKKIFPMSPYPL